MQGSSVPPWQSTQPQTLARCAFRSQRPSCPAPPPSPAPPSRSSELSGTATESGTAVALIGTARRTVSILRAHGRRLTVPGPTDVGLAVSGSRQVGPHAERVHAGHWHPVFGLLM